ncbi:DUF4255 domain-containing protein [Pantanalinema rosaneae CENA516]|uniref:DUF4255 domain-containing protein n=1 Tax=Pantanalinema rosaneae TaxID=1620701 RepID=UPI003D6DC5E2
MSNHLAIAVVTATFQRILQAAIQEDVYGARVTTVRPNTLEGGNTETGVNIYLYLITPNPAYRTPDPMTRRPKADLVKRSQVAIDLQYLVSFYGSEAELEPQRLYGSALRTLQEGLTLTTDMIRETLADPTLAFLADSDLVTQIEPVRLIPTEISVENLSKIWSVFFQTPYALSCTYKATVLLIDSEEPGQRALPVRDRRPVVAPFRQLIIEQVTARGGIHQPILADSTLIITGQRLHHPNTIIRIAGVEVAAADVTDNRIIFPLTAVPAHVLQAGVQSLQVVHPLRPHNPASPYRGVESNLAAFVLRPTILNVSVANLQSHGHGSYSAEVTVQFNLTVGMNQLVVLILNEWSVDSPKNFLFKAGMRSADSAEVVMTIDDITAGDYLVRVQIDGAESLLTIDTTPNSPTFNWYNGPRLAIG